MVEINEWLWETLYTLKKLYDHGKTSLLEQYAEHVLDGDDVGEIAIQAVYEIFAETRDYWDDGNELETYVFFDPVFDEFQRLCKLYENEIQINANENPHRDAIRSAIRSSLYFNDYSYDYWYYDGTQRDGKTKLILKLYPEFCQTCEIAGGLLEVYDAFENHVKQMEEELGMQEERTVPFPKRQAETLKEAA